LARNTTLDVTMQERLFARGEYKVYLALAHNPSLTPSLARKLLHLHNSAIEEAIFSSLATSQEILEEGFLQTKNHKALAHNNATPAPLLEKLYAQGDDAILEALASNENTPVEILYQLQLDARFERFVKTNKKFGEHIQSHNIGWLL